MSRARDLADGTFSGEFAADSPTLVVDATNDRVGVGTSSPSGLAHVYNGMLQVGSKTGDTSLQQNTDAIRIAAVPNSSTEWGGLQWYREFSDYIGAEIIAARPDAAEAKTDLIFKTSGSSADATERMRIQSDGRVLVFDTDRSRGNTDSWLYSAGNTDTTSGAMPLELAVDSTSGATRYLAGFSNVNGFIGSITVNGSTTSYNTSSDYRLKENVTPLDGAADRLAQIPVHRFNFIADPDTTVDGFLAHEVQAFVPEAITGEKDAFETVDVTDEDGNVTGTETRPVYQSIDQSKLVPLLTAALQEALQKIDALEARIATLEGGA